MGATFQITLTLLGLDGEGQIKPDESTYRFVGPQTRSAPLDLFSRRPVIHDRSIQLEGSYHELHFLHLEGARRKIAANMVSTGRMRLQATPHNLGP